MLLAAVCTLFEKDYHYGVAALVNSLYKSGFRGRVYAGYRGKLPPWAKSARREDERTDILTVADGLEVAFIRLETAVHFANYKPRFMLELLDGPAKGVGAIHYLDPDIVVKCSWEMMEAWAQGGVGLVQDARGDISATHPLRRLWNAWLAKNGFKVARELGQYYNSGYIGLDAVHRDLLEKWEAMIKEVNLSTGTESRLCLGGSRDNLFYLPEQDAFNLTLMTTTTSINSVGPDGMDFAPYGFLLSHAIGRRKPWRGRFVRAALKGVPPTKAIKAFFKFTKGPVKVLPWSQKLYLRFSLWLADRIGRVYAKSH